MKTPVKDNTGEEGKPKEDSATKKRKEPPCHDEANIDSDTSPYLFTSSNFPVISRSEKRRDREEEGCTDFDGALDRLMSLAFTIDPQLKAVAEAVYGYKIDKNKLGEEALLNHVELFNAAIATFQRLHRENEERKLVIAHIANWLLAANDGPNNNPVIRARPCAWESIQDSYYSDT